MRALLCVLLAACGGADFGPSDDDSPDGGAGDDAPPNMCVTGLDHLPAAPVVAADTRVFVEALVDNAPGVQTFEWRVFKDGVEFTNFELLDQDRVLTFSGAQAGNFLVVMDVSVAGTFCLQASRMIPVVPEGANQGQLRLHAVADGRAPLNARVLVTGVDNYPLPTQSLGTTVMAQGVVVDGPGGSPVSAYLKFMPQTGPDAFVEAFAVNGSYSATLRPERHDVLIVPVSTTFAPRRGIWEPGMTELQVDDGFPVRGTVTGPGGQGPMSGAKVQLTIDGVPSTIATTAADGTFTVLAVPIPNAPVKFDVLPPASTGLPRLVHTSTTINIGQSLAITFANTAVRTLAGSTIRRGGNALAGARLVVVGTIPNAGTIAGVTAGGTVNIQAIANGSGVLPDVMVPAVQLATIVEASPGDWSQSTTNLTGTAQVVINAPPMTPASTTVLAVTGSDTLSDVTLDLVPLGALAEAGVPTMRVVSGDAGAITASLVTGGSYDLYLSDPGNRGSQRKFPNVTTLPVNPRIGAMTRVTVSVTDGVNPVANTLVQFRCPDCSGLERTRAIAEGITGPDGRVDLAVPRP